MYLPRVRAPRLPADPALWLNTGGRALSLRAGVTYLLDFWTYGCINCVHVLDDLDFLEAKYAGQPFLVIGVHSGKFPNEKHAENVRHALLRHGIRHPVVRDDDFAVWRSYAVRAWPTLVLVDAKGYVVGTVSGEGHRQVLDEAVGAALTAAGRDGGLAGAEAPPFPALRPERRPETALAFPGKVLADPERGRLFIADTGHDRIVIAPLPADGGHDAAGCRCVGSGRAGWEDGPAATARFRAPQGMALAPNGNTLYVADAGNHAVRTVDLVSGVVGTLAGTGRQAHGPIADAGHARATDLNSPWDLLPAPGDAAVLFIAMAGSHQIARLDLRAETIAAFAGTGREGRADGPARAAAFAQPSGLATDGRGRLFVADAESSCVRCIDGPDGGAPTVRTLAGGDLFAFGDVDGVGDDARLQHPLGVAWHDGTVFIADTYNHKIRRLDPGSGRVTGWAGSASELCEPGGLSAGGDVLYVADTNCHRVRAINIASGRIAEVPLPGLCAPDLCFAERGDGAS